MMARRGLGRLLVLAGLVTAWLAPGALWARHELVDSGRFAELARQTLDAPEVSGFVAAELGREVAARLPPEAIPLVPRIESEIARVLGTESFGLLFENSVEALHRAVVHDTVEAAVLDLSGAGALIAQAVSVVDPRLAERLGNPATLGRVELASAGDVPDLRAPVDYVSTAAALVLPFAVGLLAAGVIVSPDRPRALERLGIGLATGSALLLVVSLALPSALVDQSIDEAGARAAANGVLEVVLRGLRWRTGAAAALGGVSGLAGWVWARRPHPARLA